MYLLVASFLPLFNTFVSVFDLPSIIAEAFFNKLYVAVPSIILVVFTDTPLTRPKSSII
jgi:hypothetical protein